MTRPNRYLFRMILFLGAVLAVCAPLFQPLRDAFLANAPLNGGILAVLALGIAYNFLQVARLKPEVEWVDSYRRDGAQLSQPARPHGKHARPAFRPPDTLDHIAAHLA